MPWQKGQSGNPGGRPKESAEVQRVREMAREAAPEAFALVLDLMRTAERDELRLSAAKEIMRVAGVDREALEVVLRDQARPYSEKPVMELVKGTTTVTR